MSQLLDALKSRPVGPTVVRGGDPEKDFSSQIEVGASTASVTLRDEPGATNEGTALEFLKKEGLNPDDWEVSSFRRSEWGSPNGETLESTRFSFVRKQQSAVASAMPDVEDLEKIIKKAKVKKPIKPASEYLTNFVGLADFQVGKAQERLGGTEELVERSFAALERWSAEVSKQKPHEIIIADPGDSIEGFNNVLAQHQSNDLSLTAMIRTWRRLFWAWVEEAASLAPSVKVISVPSNHCRTGPKPMNNDPNDDFGIEVLAQISDIARANEKFSHVEFYTPNHNEETVTIKAAGGKIIGVAHGHQTKRAEGLPQWLAGQALGRTSISHADIFVFGHYHNFKVQTVGDDRWLFICPTLDAGSTWFTNISGHNSAPKVFSMTIDEDGWDNIKLF